MKYIVIVENDEIKLECIGQQVQAIVVGKVGDVCITKHNSPMIDDKICDSPDVYESFKEIASYLNQLAKTHEETEQLLRRLLLASLDSRNLPAIQNDVAIRLRYPGLDGFIKECYKDANT